MSPDSPSGSGVDLMGERRQDDDAARPGTATPRRPSSVPRARPHDAASRKARRDLVVAAVLAVVVGVYGWRTATLPSSSPNQADVGPQAYPLLVLSVLSLLIVVIAALALVRLRHGTASAEHDESDAGSRQAFTQRRRETGGHGLRDVVAEWRGQPWFGLVVSVLVTAVYLQLLVWVGFVIATAVFLAIEARLIVGPDRWRGRRAWVPLAYAVLGSVAIWLLFDAALGVLLPRGLLFGY